MAIMSTSFIVLFMISFLLISHWIKYKVIRRFEAITTVFNEISNGNLSCSILDNGNDEIGQLFDSLRDMNNGLVSIITSVKNISSDIRDCTAETAAGSQDLSSRTEEQACALQETSASMEQIKIMVGNNASNAHQANKVSSNASLIAKDGATNMIEVVGTIKEIENSAKNRRNKQCN